MIVTTRHVTMTGRGMITKEEIVIMKVTGKTAIMVMTAIALQAILVIQDVDLVA
jgi:hypothetical protein